MDMLNRENTPFQAVLAALLDVERPFPPVYLHRFSDISPQNLEEVKQAWASIPLMRRQSLMEDLEELAEADTVVSFEDLARFALADVDPLVRALAIRLLWEAENKQLAPIFMRMLETDPDHLVRAAAANALGNFVYIGELEEIPEELHHQVEDSLLKTLGGEDAPSVKRNALESLGYSSRPEVPGLIEEAYHRGNNEWLASALYAMGRSADERWTDDVLKMMDHEIALIREEAARAAGELGLNEARVKLLEMVEDDEDEVQMAAAWSLSQIGGEQVRETLESLLDKVEDEDQAEIIENALDNLAFNEEMGFFGSIDFDEDGAAPQ